MSILFQVEYKNQLLFVPCIFKDDTIAKIKKKLYRHNSIFIPSITKITKINKDSKIIIHSLLDTEKDKLLEFINYKNGDYPEITEIDYQFVKDYINKDKEKVINYMKNFSPDKPDILSENLIDFCKVISDKNSIIKSNTITNVSIFWKTDKNVNVNLIEIFNFFPLSEEIYLSVITKKWTNYEENYAKYYNTFDKKTFNKTKKYKGLYLQSNDFQLEITTNGLIFLHFKNYIENSDLQTIVSDKMIKANNILKFINGKDTFFQSSDRLELLSLDNFSIKYISSVVKVPLVDRELLKKFYKDIIVEEEINISYKQTTSQSILSLLYNNNITINIFEDFEDTSVIKISNSESLEQSEIILWKILGGIETSKKLEIDDLFGKMDIKGKKKTTKKELKDNDIKFDSRECQSIRQPKLVSGKVKMNTENIINFGDKFYSCEHPTYPYPGFTKNNVVCCFKNNQKGTEKYIKNTNKETLEITLQPSNYIYNQKNLLKLSDNRYATLNNNILDIVYDPVLISQFDKLDSDIWLNPVTLADIIYITNKNKCAHKPDLSKDDILKCKNVHNKHIYFGYNSKGFPCCYDKLKLSQIKSSSNSENSEYTNEDESLFNEKYIIKIPTKILNYNQLGVLPETLNVFGTNYYRAGISNSDVKKYNFLKDYNIINIHTDNNNDYFVKCTWVPFKETQPFIVTLTNENDITDLVVFINKEKNRIEKVHNKNSTIIKYLQNFINNSCVVTEIYPQNYHFKHLKTSQYFIDTLNDNYGKCIANVFDNNDTILYVLTSKGILLPVSNIYPKTQLKKLPLDKFLEKKILYPLEDYLKVLEYLKINNVKYIRTDDPDTVGVITEFGRVVPVRNNTKKNIKYEIGIFITKLNKFKENDNIIDNNLTLLYKQSIKNHLLEDDSNKKSLKKLVKTPLNLAEKVDIIYNKFLEYIQKDYSQIKEEVIQSIAIEVVNDTKKQLLLNGIIAKNLVKINLQPNEQIIFF